MNNLPKGRLNVGFSWRSGLVNPRRLNSYTFLSDWADIIDSDHVNPICLQYEDISEDLQPIGDYITGINYINFIDGFIYICNKNNDSWYCEYCNKKFNTKKGCLFHENVYCKKKNSNIIDCSSDNDYNLSDDEF